MIAWLYPKKGLAVDAKEVAELGKLRRSVTSARTSIIYIIRAAAANRFKIRRE
jgi:hypothetical protein